MAKIVIKDFTDKLVKHGKDVSNKEIVEFL